MSILIASSLNLQFIFMYLYIINTVGLAIGYTKQIVVDKALYLQLLQCVLL
jgi:hypothetical protein